jgi:Rap1a immunity proteins
MLSCSANDISAICSIPTKNITMRLARTYRCTRTRRSHVPSRLSVARWRCQFWEDCTTSISGRKFPTGTGTLYCVPVGQMTRVVVKYTEERPERHHESLILLALQSLYEAFPCK